MVARRRPRDEDEDEPRSSTRRRSRDEDDEPRGRRRSRDEDDEPRGRRGRGRDDDDDDRRERENLRDKAVGEGWESYKNNRERAWNAPDEFEAPNAEKNEKSVLITFLDDKPFASYNQHWIERKGKKSFTCLGADCPLCDILGDRPSTYACFNVVDMTGEREPMVKVWMVRKTVAKTLKDVHG